jgi:hypothetical protein
MTTDWQNIFYLSVINGAKNYQERLGENRWEFPRDTWFQKRLQELKLEKEDKHARPTS